MGRLQGKTAIVTGASRGIGLAIARRFTDEGAQVLIASRSAPPEDVQSEDMQKGSCHWHRADISDPAQVAALFEQAVAQFGRVDVLVNNAGIAGPTALLEDCETADWRRTLAINLDGQFYCLRRAIPALKAAGGGAIVNLASTAGLYGYPRRGPYVASKWAVVGLTKSLAIELGPSGIRVNAICPGSIEGPRMDRVIAAEAAATGSSEEEVRQAYMRNASMRCCIDAEDIANMAVFLASPEARFVSGQVIAVDGHTFNPDPKV